MWLRKRGKLTHPEIITPTDYALDSWDVFFADTYSIHITNPSFLETPEFQYLYNFFVDKFPRPKVDTFSKED